MAREKITKIILADENRMLINGIDISLETEPLLEVCGLAANGLQLEEMIKLHKPDIVVANIFLPLKDGIQIIPEIMKKNKKVKWIALDCNVDASNYFLSREAGATAYITFSSNRQELVNAIYAVLKGEYYVCQQAFPIVTKQYFINSAAVKKGKLRPILTERQMEIVRLTCKGYTSNKQGVELGISSKTVDWHKRNIFRILNVHNTAGLMHYAFTYGILNPSILSWIFYYLFMDEEQLVYVIPEFLNNFTLA